MNRVCNVHGLEHDMREECPSCVAEIDMTFNSELTEEEREVIRQYEADTAYGSLSADKRDSIACAMSKMLNGDVASPKAGIKFDDDKLEWNLLPLEATEEVIKVLMLGAKKYAPDNWKHVDDHERRYYNAALRHITAWKKGEGNDPETGLSHLAHAICCLMFIVDREE